MTISEQVKKAAINFHDNACSDSETNLKSMLLLSFISGYMLAIADRLNDFEEVLELAKLSPIQLRDEVLNELARTEERRDNAELN
jgi:hypothetical protein